ncbi:MAG: hypothetical protein EBZ48_15825 [Proteobacteria bacterium]|nr:hypothetical protein [Pseudomonadota bacterium]
MNKSISEFAASALLAFGLIASSGAEAACSAATLAGNWGITSFTVYEGAFLASVNVYTFNATTGRFSSKSVGSATGYSATSGSASGSFRIGSSCLGSLTGINNAGVQFTAHFVVTEAGRTIEGEVQSASRITAAVTGHKM